MTIPKPEKGKNIFGGGNPHGLYIPMSETEQEVISRLVEADDLEIHVLGWGLVNKPRVVFGDLRVSFYYRMNFTKPEAPQKVRFFDMELRTRSGLLLYKQRMPVDPAIEVVSGMFLDMAWDIAVHSMDPNVVRQIKPGAHGLTSRRQDKDTGARTDTGNMKLTPEQRQAIAFIRRGEALVRQDALEKVVKATIESGKDIKITDKGIESPDDH